MVNGDVLRLDVVGRYMSGANVIGYHIEISNGTDSRISKIELIDSIRAGIVNNCRIQNYDGKILIRGKGINLNELPIYEDDNQIFNKGSSNNIQNKTNVIGQLMLEARIMEENRCIGYLVSDRSGLKKKLPRNTVIKLALDKMIGNARVQNYNGSVLIRGINVNLNDLPIIRMDNKDKKSVNSNQQLIIEARIMDENRCIGYLVSNQNGVKKKLPENKVIELVSKKKICNARVQNHNGSILIRGININLNELPTIKIETQNPNNNFVKRSPKYTIEARIMEENRCIGYLVSNRKGIQRKLPRDKVIELAINRMIDNARVQNYNGRELLRGINVNLTDLPIIRIDKDAKSNSKTRNAEGVNQDGYGLKIDRKVIPLDTKEIKAIGSKIYTNEDNQSAMTRGLIQGTMRVYIQTWTNGKIDVREFVSKEILTDKEKGTNITVMNRQSKEEFIVKNRNYVKGVRWFMSMVYCGIKSIYKDDTIGLMAIQSLNGNVQYDFSIN